MDGMAAIDRDGHSIARRFGAERGSLRASADNPEWMIFAPARRRHHPPDAGEGDGTVIRARRLSFLRLSCSW
jgi:hypothetical protein